MICFALLAFVLVWPRRYLRSIQILIDRICEEQSHRFRRSRVRLSFVPYFVSTVAEMEPANDSLVGSPASNCASLGLSQLLSALVTDPQLDDRGPLTSLVVTPWQAGPDNFVGGGPPWPLEGGQCCICARSWQDLKQIENITDVAFSLCFDGVEETA